LLKTEKQMLAKLVNNKALPKVNRCVQLSLWRLHLQKCNLIDKTLGGRVTIIISKGHDDGAEAAKKRIRAVYVKKTHFSPLCSSIPPKASRNAEHPKQRQLKKTTHGS